MKLNVKIKGVKNKNIMENKEITINLKLTISAEELRMALESITKILGMNMPEIDKISIQDESAGQNPPKKKNHVPVPETGVSYDENNGSYKVQMSLFGASLLIESNMEKEDAIEFNRVFRNAVAEDIKDKKILHIKRIRRSGQKYLSFANNCGVEEFTGMFDKKEDAERASREKQRKISKAYMNKILAQIYNTYDAEEPDDLPENEAVTKWRLMNAKKQEEIKEQSM